MTRHPLTLPVNHICRIQLPSLLLLTAGEGVVDIDFKRYFFRSDEILTLAPGQYIRLLSGNLQITICEFSDDEVARFNNTKFLFRHLVGVAHVPLPAEAHSAHNSITLDALVQACRAFL